MRGRMRTVLAGTVLLALGLPAAARGQGPEAEAVEALRLVLKAPAADLAERDRELRRKAQGLRTLGELRDALLLAEWRDEDANKQLAALDRSCWIILKKNFDDVARGLLKRGDEPTQAAVIGLLAETGLAAQERGVRRTVVRGFGPDLVRLAKRGSPAVREAAARALGWVNPTVDVAVSALGELSEAPEPEVRLAAAEGFLALMRNTARMGRRGTAGAVALAPAEVAAAGSAVVPAAAKGLYDPDGRVRQVSAEVVREAAAALAALVPDPRRPYDAEDRKAYAQEVEREQVELLPLAAALQGRGPALGNVLGDPEPEVRLAARRALAELAQARERLQRRQASAGAAPAAADRAALPLTALTAALEDPDVQARLSALDVLETLGAAAAPAAPALVKALSDPNRFVRWAAARTLGKLAPAEAETAVPALAQLLGDGDTDLRQAAASALRAYGPAARAAVPALTAAVSGPDVPVRLLAIAALEQIWPGAESAVPVLSAVLYDRDARVRQAAAHALGRFGPSARDALEALQTTLNDSSAEVRTAAHDALLHITQPAPRR